MRDHIGHDEQQREEGGRAENEPRIELEAYRDQRMALQPSVAHRLVASDSGDRRDPCRANVQRFSMPRSFARSLLSTSFFFRNSA